MNSNLTRRDFLKTTAAAAIATGTLHSGLAQTDKKLAMNPKEGFIGKPQPAAVASFCGKCHSDAAFTAVKPGLEIAEKAHQPGLQALADAAFRCRGLAPSLIVIGLAIVAIYLKVREIETR